MCMINFPYKNDYIIRLKCVNPFLMQKYSVLFLHGKLITHIGIVVTFYIHKFAAM